MLLPRKRHFRQIRLHICSADCMRAVFLLIEVDKCAPLCFSQSLRDQCTEKMSKGHLLFDSNVLIPVKILRELLVGDKFGDTIRSILSTHQVFVFDRMQKPLRIHAAEIGSRFCGLDVTQIRSLVTQKGHWSISAEIYDNVLRR